MVELLWEDLVVETRMHLCEARKPSATIRVVKGKVDSPFFEFDRVGTFECEDDEVVVRMPEGAAQGRSVGGQLRDAGVVETPFVGNLVDFAISCAELFEGIFASVGKGVMSDHKRLFHLFATTH